MPENHTDSRPAPDPESPEKPAAPTQLTKPSWKYIARKTLREFSDDQCTDLAAALTYYSVLAIFPGLLAVISTLGLFVRAFSLDPILDNLGYGLLADRTSVRELLQVREHLEASFMPLVVRAATPQQRRVLRSVVDRMGERAARGEVFSEEDRFFHRVLYEHVLKFVRRVWRRSPLDKKSVCDELRQS